VSKTSKGELMELATALPTSKDVFKAKLLELLAHLLEQRDVEGLDLLEAALASLQMFLKELRES